MELDMQQIPSWKSAGCFDDCYILQSILEMPFNTFDNLAIIGLLSVLNVCVLKI